MFSGYPLRNCETPFETGLPPLESANLENELSQGLNTAMYMTHLNWPKVVAFYQGSKSLTEGIWRGDCTILSYVTC